MQQVLTLILMLLKLYGIFLYNCLYPFGNRLSKKILQKYFQSD